MTGSPKRLHATFGWSRIGKHLSGEGPIGKAVLKDFINATVGFEKLDTLARIPSRSLHRMLSPGNPSTAHFFAILRALQEQTGVQLKVRAATGTCMTELRGLTVDERFSGVQPIHPEPNESLPTDSILTHNVHVGSGAKIRAIIGKGVQIAKVLFRPRPRRLLL